MSNNRTLRPASGLKRNPCIQGLNYTFCTLPNLAVVIAYSLLHKEILKPLHRLKLSISISSDQQPTGILKCNHPRCLTCSFLQEGQTSYTFFTTKETREITNYISCHSKNLIYLIQCKKCHCQYIGETKRQLNERFGEHRRSILNHHQLSNPTPVSLHFNQPGHSINDVHLIPLELMRSTHDSVRKAREAHLINKAKTLHPLGINRRDEAHQ